MHREYLPTPVFAFQRVPCSVRLSVKVWRVHCLPLHTVRVSVLRFFLFFINRNSDSSARWDKSIAPSFVYRSSQLLSNLLYSVLFVLCHNNDSASRLDESVAHCLWLSVRLSVRVWRVFCVFFIVRRIILMFPKIIPFLWK